MSQPVTHAAANAAANALLSRAVALLTEGKAYAEAEASLGRVQSTLLPAGGDRIPVVGKV